MVDISKETEKKIEQLQLFEQNVQNFIVQKQQFESQLIEIDVARKELEGVEEAYKIVGNIMVLSKKKDVVLELEDKERIAKLHLKTIEKQEEFLRKKAKVLQQEVLNTIKGKE